MKIQLKNKLTETTIQIETEHNDPDKAIQLKFSGNADEVSIFKREISETYGFYGHTIDLKQTTNLDLASGVRSLTSFEVVFITPEIKPKPLPPDVQS